MSSFSISSNCSNKMIPFIFALLSCLTCFPTNLASHVQSYRPPKLIVFSFDAFRLDYLHPTLTPNLYRLSRLGVMANKMQSVYVTKTFPNHHSISTGMYQETHGIVSNYMYDSNTNSTFHQSNTDSRWWDNGRVNPIWNVNERFDFNQRRSALMMWPGTGAMINGRLPHFLYPYENSLKWKQRVDIMIEWLNKNDDRPPANLVMAYFNEPDSTSHKFGPFSTQVREKIMQVDDTVQYFIDQLQSNRLLSETNIIVLSDHGMVEVDETRVIDLSTIVDVTLFDVYGTSPVLNLWMKDKMRIHEIYDQLLSNQKSHHYTVYLPSTIPKEYHYANNERILDIVIEADEGYEIVQRLKDNAYFEDLISPRSVQSASVVSNDEPNSNDILKLFQDGRNPKRKVWGNHGYSYKYESMRPMFVGYGPAFRKHFQFESPFENIDLYPLMCEILHIRSSDPFFDRKLCRSNGSLARVSQMLRPIQFSGDYESNNGTVAFQLLLVFIVGFVVILLCASAFTCLVNATNRSRKRHQLAKIDLSDDIIDINIDCRLTNVRQKRLTTNLPDSVEQISLLGTKRDYMYDHDQLTD